MEKKEDPGIFVLKLLIVASLAAIMPIIAFDFTRSVVLASCPIDKQQIVVTHIEKTPDDWLYDAYLIRANTISPLNIEGQLINEKVYIEVVLEGDILAKTTRCGALDRDWHLVSSNNT